MIPAIRLALSASTLAVCALCVALPAQAAATRDEIAREALLRGYTTQDAERRYNESNRLTDGASKNAGNALASGLSALAANAQRRMDASNALNDRLWFAIENGLDFPLKTQGELDALKALLRRFSEGSGKDYNFYARRLHAEYALHLRPRSALVFPVRNHEEAARLARMNAYAQEDFHPWAALTLAKLHLNGKGVPQDEGEARYLIDLCTRHARLTFRPSLADEVGCYVMDAQMHRNGWGGPVDETAAQEALKYARTRLPAALSNTLSDEALMSNYR